MFKPFHFAGIIILCASGSLFAQSTGTVVSGDAAFRIQLQQEMIQHRADLQKADADFVKGLAAKTDTERQTAIKERAKQKQSQEKTFRAAIHEKKKAYRKKKHDEYVAYMKSKLEQNTKLSAAEKNEMISRMEQQYKSAADYEDKQFTAGQEFSDKLSDASLTKEQRTQLLKEQAEKAQSAAKAHKEAQIAQNRAYREELRAKRQAELKVKAGNSTK